MLWNCGRILAKSIFWCCCGPNTVQNSVILMSGPYTCTFPFTVLDTQPNVCCRSHVVNIHQLLLWVDISPNSVLSINKPTWACSCCESKPSYMLHFRCCWCWCGVIPHPNSVAILGRYPSKFSLLFLWVDTHPNLVWCWVARYLSKTSFLLWTDTHPIPICCSCGSVPI